MTLVNQNISHYKIVSQIGAGGMGEVYLALDTAAGQSPPFRQHGPINLGILMSLKNTGSPGPSPNGER